jgi:hypothetical protein
MIILNILLYICRFYWYVKNIPYFPAHKTHFFPEKCDLNLTSILCAEGIISKLINSHTAIIHLYREISKFASKS